MHPRRTPVADKSRPGAGSERTLLGGREMRKKGRHAGRHGATLGRRWMRGGRRRCRGRGLSVSLSLSLSNTRIHTNISRSHSLTLALSLSHTIPLFGAAEGRKALLLLGRSWMRQGRRRKRGRAVEGRRALLLETETSPDPESGRSSPPPFCFHPGGNPGENLKSISHRC